MQDGQVPGFGTTLEGTGVLLDQPPTDPVEVAALLLDDVADRCPAGVDQRVVELNPTH
jgi:hypothetical protein